MCLWLTLLVTVLSVTQLTVLAYCGGGQYANTDDKCQACPVGWYRSPGNTTDVCQSCPTGWYGSSGTGQTTCLPCGAGKSQKETGQTTCNDCPDNWFSSQPGDACSECDSGKYTLNPDWSFSNDKTQYPSAKTYCIDCLGGKFGLGCKNCPIGYARSETDDGGACISCNLGRFADKIGAPSCQSCPAGWSGWKEGELSSATCQICPAGTFQDAAGQQSCKPCPVDTFNDLQGASLLSQCVSCETNFATFTTTNKIKGGASVDACVCNAGFYKITTLSDAEKEMKLSAGEAAYSYKDEMDGKNPANRKICVECSKGANCDSAGLTLNTLTGKKGYWRPEKLSHHFINCLSSEKVDGMTELEWSQDRCCASSCNRSDIPITNSSDENYKWLADQQCKEGYTGPMCRVCEIDYVSVLGECIACEGGSDFFSALIILGWTCAGVCFTLIFYLLCKNKKKVEQGNNAMRVFGQIKIILMFLQVLGSMGSSMSEVPWPSNFLNFFTPLQFTNFDLIGIFGLSGSCSLAISYSEQFMLHMFVPVLIFPTIGVAWGFVHLIRSIKCCFNIKNCCKRSWIYCCCNGGTETIGTVKLRVQDEKACCSKWFTCKMKIWDRFAVNASLEALQSQISKIVVLAILLIYPGLATRVFTMIHCKRFDGMKVNVLMKEFGMVCFSSEHWNYLVAAMGAFLVYILGIPFALWFVLYKNKSDLYYSDDLYKKASIKKKVIDKIAQIEEEEHDLEYRRIKKHNRIKELAKKKRMMGIKEKTGSKSSKSTQIIPTNGSDLDQVEIDRLATKKRLHDRILDKHKADLEWVKDPIVGIHPNPWGHKAWLSFYLIQPIRFTKNEVIQVDGQPDETTFATYKDEEEKKNRTWKTCKNIALIDGDAGREIALRYYDQFLKNRMSGKKQFTINGQQSHNGGKVWKPIKCSKNEETKEWEVVEEGQDGEAPVKNIKARTNPNHIKRVNQGGKSYDWWLDMDSKHWKEANRDSLIGIKNKNDNKAAWYTIYNAKKNEASKKLATKARGLNPWKQANWTSMESMLITPLEIHKSSECLKEPELLYKASKQRIKLLQEKRKEEIYKLKTAAKEKDEIFDEDDVPPVLGDDVIPPSKFQHPIGENDAYIITVESKKKKKYTIGDVIEQRIDTKYEDIPVLDEEGNNVMEEYTVRTPVSPTEGEESETSQEIKEEIKTRKKMKQQVDDKASTWKVVGRILYGFETGSEFENGRSRQFKASVGKAFNRRSVEFPLAQIDQKSEKYKDNSGKKQTGLFHSYLSRFSRIKKEKKIDMSLVPEIIPIDDEEEEEQNEDGAEQTEEEAKEAEKKKLKRSTSIAANEKRSKKIQELKAAIPDEWINVEKEEYLANQDLAVLRVRRMDGTDSIFKVRVKDERIIEKSQHLADMSFENKRSTEKERKQTVLKYYFRFTRIQSKSQEALYLRAGGKLRGARNTSYAKEYDVFKKREEEATNDSEIRKQIRKNQKKNENAASNLREEREGMYDAQHCMQNTSPEGSVEFEAFVYKQKGSSAEFQEIEKVRRMQAAYGSLYMQYEHGFWWFESVIVLYKMLMTGAMVIIDPGTPIQPLVATFLLLFFCFLVLKSAPYNETSADWANFLANISLLMTTLGAFALTMNRGKRPSEMEDDSLQNYLNTTNTSFYNNSQTYMTAEEENLANQGYFTGKLVSTNKAADPNARTFDDEILGWLLIVVNGTCMLIEFFIMIAFDMGQWARLMRYLNCGNRSAALKAWKQAQADKNKGEAQLKREREEREEQAEQAREEARKERELLQQQLADSAAKQAKEKKNRKKKEDKLKRERAELKAKIKADKEEQQKRENELAVAQKQQAQERLKKGIEQIFKHYDTNEDGVLDDIEFLRLINNSLSRTGVGTKKNKLLTFPVKDFQAVIKTLDVNNNGTVEIDELVRWVTSSVAARNARSGDDDSESKPPTDFELKLDILLDAFEKYGKMMLEDAHAANKVRKEEEDIKMREAVSTLFDYYDVDNDSTINLSELQLMLNNTIKRSKLVMKAPFTREEVQQVMDALDGEDGSDSNGTIEKLELQAWVSAGIKRPIEERAKFASLSDFNKKLDQFLEGMSIFVKRITGVDVDFLRTNIGKLFDFYDVDNSGAIDENELQEMLQNTLTRSGVSEETFTKTDVQNLAAALNETDIQNFAVSIQKDQLIKWIINGLKRTQDEMKVFEMKSATNVLLNKFLIACRIYATQLDVLEEEEEIKQVIAGEVQEVSKTETEMSEAEAPSEAPSKASSKAPSKAPSETPAESETAAVEEAPVEDQAESKETSPAAKDAVADDTPADESPAEEAPLENEAIAAPSEDATSKDAPSEDAPSEDAPSEDAPSEEAPCDDEIKEDETSTMQQLLVVDETATATKKNVTKRNKRNKRPGAKKEKK